MRRCSTLTARRRALPHSTPPPTQRPAEIGPISFEASSCGTDPAEPLGVSHADATCAARAIRSAPFPCFPAASTPALGADPELHRRGGRSGCATRSCTGSRDACLSSLREAGNAGSRSIPSDIRQGSHSTRAPDGGALSPSPRNVAETLVCMAGLGWLSEYSEPALRSALRVAGSGLDQLPIELTGTNDLSRPAWASGSATIDGRFLAKFAFSALGRTGSPPAARRRLRDERRRRAYR